jgi:beta-lactamase class A
MDKKTYFIISGTTLVALLTGWSVGYYYNAPDKPISQQRLNSGSYTYINPLLDYIEDPSSPLLNREVDALRAKIEDDTNSALSRGFITAGSVYYRDLNNGPWFSAGSDTEFKAASLFKIPLMIAIFKQAETDPSILERTITYEKPFENVVQHNVDSSNKTIELGQSYTILQLVESMIIYSDNYAAYLLLNQIDASLVTRVFSDLSLAVPDQNVEETITPRKYATFLRVLYNATYLNREYSEKSLEILSRSTFSHGIRSVISKETLASTKYGIAVTNDGQKQLHECGIIYWTKDRPHVVCVMTTGNNYDEMANFIKNVTADIQTAVLEKQI